MNPIKKTEESSDIPNGFQYNATGDNFEGKKAESLEGIPFNLPHDDSQVDLEKDYFIVKKFKLPKKQTKLVAKIVIVLVILAVSLPRIFGNISSTVETAQVEAEKLPGIFPSLTTTVKSIGTFTYNGFHNAFSSIKENLASMAELLYKRKLPNIGDETNITEETTTPVVEVKEFPSRIIIDKIGVDASVLNPTETSIEALDESLKYGVVRYPKSGLLGEDDNVFLFGHNTSIEVVRNESYKALNGLNNLEKGDIIKLQSDKNEYLYQVNSITMEKDSNVKVEFNTGKKELTISTCNVLGNKEDRYVVNSEFLVSYPIKTTSETVVTTENVVTPAEPAVTPTNPTIVATTPVQPTVVPAQPTTPPAREITPGERVETVVPIQIGGGTVMTPSDPNGIADLSVEITEIGILDPDTNVFIATSTLNSKDKIAFKFIISNIGTKKVSGWSFTSVLPTRPLYMYNSSSQENLNPGERIEYALGFDRPQIGTDLEIIVNADPTKSFNESNENNNIVKKLITVTE